ncbi:uncharacterized protein F5147DRAFT_771135 [Suillus discolor]|uniref:Uncharacterized protein n=1 Tax=Suillus discolor TaxID=1912936 RepID=A0A9P7JWI7_9AGAM|nr:uncharacterized protein F5147DRAFT_771135 [Suillus discolor]KAG2112591.1 hypothetical protein F5147DRAFT_771135 [Suillus discolor]
MFADFITSRSLLQGARGTLFIAAFIALDVASAATITARKDKCIVFAMWCDLLKSSKFFFGVKWTAKPGRSDAQREKIITLERSQFNASSSRAPKIHTTQTPSASSSQLPPPTATASTLFAVTSTTGASRTLSRSHNIGAEWRARFVGWICRMPIQNADD